MKQFKYVALAVIAVFVFASAVVVSAQGPMPPQGTPPAGQRQQGQPPHGLPGQGLPGQGQAGQGPQGQPMPNDWQGVVQTVTSSSLTVLRSNNETFTAVISSTTRIELMTSPSAGTVNDILVGSNVTVDGRKNADGSIAAIRISVEPAGSRAAGMVSAVSGTTITLTNQKDTITVITTASTKFLKGKNAASLSDVTRGLFVMVYGTKPSDGSISATYVIVNDGLPGQGRQPSGQAQGQSGQNPAQGQPTQGQAQGQPTRNQTPPPTPNKSQTPPARPTRNETPPSGSDTRPAPPPGQELAQSGQLDSASQDGNVFDQFIQWLSSLFGAR